MSSNDRPAEDRAYADAYQIAWGGACNPVAIATSLARHATALSRELGSTTAVLRHPALECMAGQLAYLYGLCPGPSSEALTAVMDRARALGLASDPEAAPGKAQGGAIDEALRSAGRIPAGPAGAP